jgi:predicted dinucleotide-binding enzyme
MEISIIGAGAIGTAIARLLTGAGIPVSIANSRGPSSLAPLIIELGSLAHAVTAQEASQAEIVFLAVNWSRIPSALQDLGPWNGRVVVDATNPIEAPLFKPIDLDGTSSSERVAQQVPGAHLVKAFNHLAPPLLADLGRDAGAAVRRRIRSDPVATKVGSYGYFSFSPDGNALGHHGHGYLRWFAGPKNGPVTVTGVDIAEVIASLQPSISRTKPEAVSLQNAGIGCSRKNLSLLRLSWVNSGKNPMINGSP